MENAYEQVSIDTAAKELHMDAMTLREVIEQGTFPFPLGYWIKHEERRAFWIYRGLLNQAKAKIEGKV